MEEAPGFGLISSALATEAIWKVKEQVEDSVAPLCISAFQSKSVKKIGMHFIQVCIVVANKYFSTSKFR